MFNNKRDFELIIEYNSYNEKKASLSTFDDILIILSDEIYAYQVKYHQDQFKNYDITKYVKESKETRFSFESMYNDWKVLKEFYPNHQIYTHFLSNRVFKQNMFSRDGKFRDSFINDTARLELKDLRNTFSTHLNPSGNTNEVIVEFFDSFKYVRGVNIDDVNFIIKAMLNDNGVDYNEHYFELTTLFKRKSKEGKIINYFDILRYFKSYSEQYGQIDAYIEHSKNVFDSLIEILDKKDISGFNIDSVDVIFHIPLLRILLIKDRINSSLSLNLEDWIKEHLQSGYNNIWDKWLTVSNQIKEIRNKLVENFENIYTKLSFQSRKFGNDSTELNYINIRELIDYIGQTTYKNQLIQNIGEDSKFNGEECTFYYLYSRSMVRNEKKDEIENIKSYMIQCWNDYKSVKEEINSFLSNYWDLHKLIKIEGDTLKNAVFKKMKTVKGICYRCQLR